MEWLATFAAALALWLLWTRTGKRGALVLTLQDQERRLLELGQRVRAMERALAERAVQEPAPATTESPAVAAPAAPPPVEAAPVAVTPPPAATPPVEATANALPVDAPPAKKGIDWETWFGVRGAGALGGIVLALAGVLSFQYSIEHGLISPVMRVVSGVVVGVACIVSSEWVLRRRYALNANAVAGAGLVILYAAFWAARALYQLIPFQAAFVLMVVVTATCCALAIRHRSLLVALLGLVGGFATPILLSTGEDRPIGLFGYVFLLDVGLLAVAYKRRWPVLATVSLGATLFFQGMWIFERMGPERLFLGLAIIAVFAVLYTVFLRVLPVDPAVEGGKAAAIASRRLQAVALLAPFAFVIYFAGDAEVSPRFYPLAALMGLLLLGANVIATAQKLAWLASAAGSASVAVTALWIMTHDGERSLPWETSLACVLLAAIAHVFVERERRLTPERDSAGVGAIAVVAGLPLLLMLGAARADDPTPWPWLTAFAGLLLLAVRHGGFVGRERLQAFAAAVAATALTVLAKAHGDLAEFPSVPLYLGVSLLFVIGLHLTSAAWPNEHARRAGWLAAATASAVLIFFSLTEAYWKQQPALYFLGYVITLALLGAIAATRRQSGVAFAVMVALTAFVFSMWTAINGGRDIHVPIDGHALPLQLFAVVLLTAWPFLVARCFLRDRFAWYAAALAGPLAFQSLRMLFVDAFGDRAIAVLPLGLGALSLTAAMAALRVWPRGEGLRKTSLVWFSAVALCFVSVAIPLQLEKQWITIGWALEGFAVTLLWVRLDHTGLKYFATVLLAAAAVRLSLNLSLLAYHARGPLPILNWLLYTYWLPTACMLGASVFFRRYELQRLSDWERARLYVKGWPWASIVTGAAGVLVFFAWINLAIADWFATGEQLALDFSRMPARELTRSICWAIYAVALLLAGVLTKSRGLRWMSLIMLYVTIAKVFVWDLGELKDLYRVMSLCGAAVALIAVSLAYQRFVFRRTT